jgi:tRNA A-37 threonylcarbamoyl transferase component Bud32
VTAPVEIVAPRAERVAWAPTDVLRLIVAGVALIVTLVVGALFDDTVVDFFEKLLRGLDALPTWLVTALYDLSQLMALVLFGGGLVVALYRREWRFLLAIVAAMAIASVLFELTRPLLDHAARRVTDVNNDYTPVDSGDLPESVAVVTALVTAAAPWVSRRWRRGAWFVVIALSISWFVASPIEFDVVVALMCGWFAGAFVIAAMGAPSRRPTGTSIAGGLAAVGVPLARLEQADVDARGSSPYFATACDGMPLFVKALGEDERSADVMFRVYRRLVPRHLGDEKAFSTLRRAVEHEALVALAARDLGVRTPRLVAFTSADPNGYVLAYEQIAGRSFDRVPSDRVTDGALSAIWEQVALMRAHRVAHRDLRLANVFLDDRECPWIIDFGFSELAASDLLLDTDVAELLASSTTIVGRDRALAVAASVVGPVALVAARDRLHPATLSGATRTAMKAAPGLLDDLRTHVTTLS